MDKITRIHLAKIPYEISHAAEAKLKKYIDEIRDELDEDSADEILADIEVRITEILSDRKIKRNDVITVKDVSAIQEQLGSPAQITDGESKTTHAKSPSNESRKLLRDVDGAYIGGVASGLGAYFAIDPIFIRMIFVVLTFVSGLGIVLYVLFWLLVPVAKSSSDKLQMSGQPVTVATLQRYRTRLGNRPNNMQVAIVKTLSVVKKILMVTVTALCILFILYLLGVLGVASSFTVVYPFRSIFASYHIDYVVLGLIWVIGLSLVGLLVTLVMKIWGHRSIQLKFSAISFLVVLIIAISGTAAMGVLVYNHFTDEYGNGKSTSALAVNNMTPTVQPTKITVQSDANLNLTYVISDQEIHATYQAYPGMSKPAIAITNNGGVLSINSNDLSKAAPNCLGNLCKSIYLPIKVTLYGPSISSLSDTSGATVSISNANLGDSLTISAENESTINLNNSYAANMNISATVGSTVQANDSNAQQTNVTVDSSSTVYAPNTINLTASLPENCDQDDVQVLYLSGYSGQILLNGQTQTTNDLDQNSCVSTDF